MTATPLEGPLRATEEEIARTFRDYDTNDDKSLSVSEIKQALAKLKLRVADTDLQALVCKIDTDKSNTVSFEEFKAFYREREETLYTAFVNLNSSHQRNSVLTAASVRGGLSAMNLKASDEEIRKFIQRLDRNQDGHVSFDEFRDCLLLLPPTNARAVFDTFRDSMYIQHSIGEYSPPLDLVPAHAPSQLRGALGVLISPVSAQLIGCGGRPFHFDANLNIFMHYTDASIQRSRCWRCQSHRNGATVPFGGSQPSSARQLHHHVCNERHVLEGNVRLLSFKQHFFELITTTRLLCLWPKSRSRCVDCCRKASRAYFAEMA